jgi:hypothetical protein
MLDENQSKSVRDQRGVAFHEAGHVIAAAALGLAIGHVAIAVDGDDAKGAAEIEDSSKLSLVDQLAICAAGLEAQRLFAAPTHRGAGWGDHGDMIKLIGDLSEEKSRKVRFDRHQRAYNLLIRYAEQVERLANHLLTNKCLVHGELRNVLNID